ncbi:hypothetical protein [Micromonospora sonneratiae]|uniref:Uncharacterized protein n=1 Tax=Micromonospora sonneratiae TaxID=1184706 RepID=A0ABW3YC63_9ACTN
MATHGAGGEPVRLGWRGRLAAGLTGAGGGMGINVLSNDLKYPGVGG